LANDGKYSGDDWSGSELYKAAAVCPSVPKSLARNMHEHLQPNVIVEKLNKSKTSQCHAFFNKNHASF